MGGVSGGVEGATSFYFPLTHEELGGGGAVDPNGALIVLPLGELSEG